MVMAVRGEAAARERSQPEEVHGEERIPDRRNSNCKGFEEGDGEKSI